MLKIQMIKVGNTRIMSRVIKYAILFGAISVLAACDTIMCGGHGSFPRCGAW